MLRTGFLVVWLSAGTASAEVRKLEVRVDATLEVEVGTLIGVVCDQPPRLVDASLKTRPSPGGDVNVLVLKGLAPGTTQCRVGNDALGGSRLFEIVVRSAR